MNYAIIEDNVCTNIIVAESDFAKQIGAVALPDGYGIGDLYSKGKWTKKPEPKPPEPTPAEQREQAYETMPEKSDGTPLLPWHGENLTVDAANNLWLKYTAEGNTETADVLQALIHEAKEYIRVLYPDKGV